MPLEAADRPLTPLEWEAVEWLARTGLNGRQIAAIGGPSQDALKWRVGTACRRLGVRGVRALVRHCVEEGWVEEGYREDPQVTVAQRSYLEAFDRLLRARDDTTARIARQTMRKRLLSVFEESGQPEPPVRLHRRLQSPRALPGELLPHLRLAA